MTIAVDWDVKHQFKQTNKNNDYNFLFTGHPVNAEYQCVKIPPLVALSTSAWCSLTETIDPPPSKVITEPTLSVFLPIIPFYWVIYMQ